MKIASRPKSKASKAYLYKGIFTCGECGCMVTNEKQKGHVYLRCTKKKGPCGQKYVREEAMTEQVAEALLAMSLPEDDADWMLEHLDACQDRERQEAERVANSIRHEIDQIDTKAKRLQAAYLDEVVSLEEFRSSKTTLVSERRSKKERLDRLEDEGTNRLEPVRAFLKSSKQAGLSALTGNHEENRDWLRKAGSNRRVLSGCLVMEARGAWKLVATSRLLANNPERRISVARGILPELVGVHDHQRQAERAGFEPAVAAIPLRRFSKPLPSATRPPLRQQDQPLYGSRGSGSIRPMHTCRHHAPPRLLPPPSPPFTHPGNGTRSSLQDYRPSRSQAATGNRAERPAVLYLSVPR